MITIEQFFNSSETELPKQRQVNDFQTYLLQIHNAYKNQISKLNSSCPIGSEIQKNANLINYVSGWVRGSVKQYLEGQPETAYRSLKKGIYDLDEKLVSKQISPDDLGRLYRMSKLKPQEQLTKNRLFHIPSELRHFVGRHRYGIPGFPCLYLGGSLQICQIEIDVQDVDLYKTAIAEFAPIRCVKLLDFGYRPEIIAQWTKSLALCSSQPNPDRDKFIVNYAVCWPLISACSIIRMHNAPFAAEYIVPQLLLQWVMQETQCDGIRYFSTRVQPNTNIPTGSSEGAMNYVFPATQLPAQGYSQKLKNLFNFTDACTWSNGATLEKSFTTNTNKLATMQKSKLR